MDVIVQVRPLVSQCARGSCRWKHIERCVLVHGKKTVGFD